MQARARSAIAGLAAIAGLGLTACGGGSEPEMSTAAGGEAIEIADFKYAPPTLTVPAGTEVTWGNSDEAPHTATADDGSFDTGTLQRGDGNGLVLDEPGTYDYSCRFHAFMKGTVTVE